MTMEFLRQNLYNTTSMVVVNSNTDSAQYLFDNGTRLVYDSSGYGTDGTSAVISIKLPSNTVISHILLRNHNLKTFSIYYNSGTANSLYSTTTNSASSTYISFASVTVNSIDIQMKATIDANEEKSIGELWVSELDVSFEHNPANQNYDPILSRKQILHEMPDGGTIAYNIREKFQVKMKWKFITDDFRNDLLTVYERAKPLIFIPFPTTSGWDGIAYECVWTSKWDFTYSSNVKTGGWEGSIALAETPGG